MVQACSTGKTEAERSNSSAVSFLYQVCIMIICDILSLFLIHSLAGIKSLLALVAYKFTSGPFKMMWVKFGYDPRTDPPSKVYQSLDIRVPKDITSVVRGSKIYSCRSRRSGYMDSKHGVFQYA